MLQSLRECLEQILFQATIRPKLFIWPKIDFIGKLHLSDLYLLIAPYHAAKFKKHILSRSIDTRLCSFGHNSVKIECLGQKKVFRKFWLSDCYQLIVLHQAAKPESNPLNRYSDISLHNFKPQQTKLSIWPKQFQQNFIFWGFNLPLPCCKIWKKFLEQILRNSLKWKRPKIVDFTQKGIFFKI